MVLVLLPCLTTARVNFIQQNSSNLRLQHYLRRHVVCDAELQVCEDALHAVESLLPGGS